MKRPINSAVLPGNLLDTHVGQFTVGLLKLNQNLPILSGSGTLVEFGSVAGVLTCAHVVDELLHFMRVEAAAGRDAELGLVCFPVRPTQRQGHKVHLNLTDHLLLRSGSFTSRGPDIAFLKLPDASMNQLRASASVLSITRHKQLQQAPAPQSRSTLTIVSGAIDDLSSITSKPQATTLNVEGLMNVSKLRRKLRPHGGFDRWLLTPTFSGGVTPPKSYEGTSGGGVWRLGLKPDNTGTFAVVEARLSGVAYWQTKNKDSGSDFELIGHGPRTLYEKLIPAVEARWP